MPSWLKIRTRRSQAIAASAAGVRGSAAAVARRRSSSYVGWSVFNAGLPLSTRW